MGIGGSLGGVTGGNSGDEKKKNIDATESALAARKMTQSHLNQITVLRAMSGQFENADDENSDASYGQTIATTTGGAPSLHLQIEEISEVTRLGDEKEVQRILFILEGQKLVAPYPEGDFTSRIWHITPQGKSALRNIEGALTGE